VKVSLDLDKDLYNKIKANGKKNDRKVAAEIRFVLKERYENK